MTQQMCNDAEQDLEFLPVPIWDMGTVQDSSSTVQDTSGNKRNIATAMYFYDDKTSVFFVPGKIWEPSTELAVSGVPPLQANGVVTGSTPPNAVGRCGETISDEYSPNVHHALHVAGGPFIEWGGGMGRMLKCINTDSTSSTRPPWLASLNLNKYLCAARVTTVPSVSLSVSEAACSSATKKPEDRTDIETTMVGVCPQRDLNYARDNKADESDEPFMTGMALDVSDHVMHDPSGVDIPVRGWDGIAFWARRSPNSQSGIRIAVADKYVDDDMSYLSLRYDATRPRYCERKIVCSCQNNKPCTPVSVTDNIFDAVGNRVKWAAQDSSGFVRGRVAVDGPPINPINGVLSDQDIQDIRHNRHSLIDMSGAVVRDPTTGQQKTFDDSTAVIPYEGPSPGNGQPYDTDVIVPHIESYCFDPAVDRPPPGGTPLSQMINRAYQNNRITAPDPPNYNLDPATGFFVNTAAPKSIDEANGLQLPVTDLNHTEQPGYFYMPCGASYCDFEYPSFQAVDPQSFGKSCTPFSFVGSITYSYCFNPGDNPPPEASQQCGDFWMKSVDLSTDWQLIKVRFDELVQQGWAKRQYQFDLSNITDVRLEWDRGWLDVWISDVRFYRTKQQ